MTSAATYGGKDFHIDSTSPLPPHNIMSESSFYARVQLFDTVFKGLKSRTKLGMDYHAFNFNPW